MYKPVKTVHSLKPFLPCEECVSQVAVLTWAGIKLFLLEILNGSKRCVHFASTFLVVVTRVRCLIPARAFCASLTSLHLMGLSGEFS